MLTMISRTDAIIKEGRPTPLGYSTFVKSLYTASLFHLQS